METTRSSHSLHTKLPLCAVILLGSVARLYGLSAQSLWNDELYSWEHSHYTTAREVIAQGVLPDVHPPGYQLILYLFTQICGDSEVSMRGLSAVAGILSIPVLYRLGAILFEQRVALIASALLAVSWAPIYFSQEVRSYSLLMLVTLGSSLSLLKLGIHIREQATKPPLLAYGVLYILSAGVALYVHYFGVLFVGLQAIAFLFFCTQLPSARRLTALSVGVCVMTPLLALYIPWIPSMLTQMKRGGHTWIAPPDLDAPLRFVAFWFNHSGVIAGLFLLVLAVAIVKGAPAVLSRGFLAALGTRAALLAFWIVAPFAVSFVMSKVSTPVLTNRNLIVSAPALYLAAAYAIAKVFDRQNAWRIAASTIIGGLIVHLVFQMEYYTTPQKTQYREAVRYVVEQTRQSRLDAPVVAYAWSGEAFNYYFERFRSEQRVQLLVGESSDLIKLDDFLASHKSLYFWYVVAHKPPDRAFLGGLMSKYDVVSTRSFYDAQVFLIDCTGHAGRVGVNSAGGAREAQVTQFDARRTQQ